MFEIVPVDVDVPSQLAPIEEIESMANELVLGESLRERAMFRMWRLWKTRAYLEVVDGEDGSTALMFKTFEEFLGYFCGLVDVSRAKIFSRIRTYSELEWLGYPEAQMLYMMSNRPGMYSKTLNKILEWDSQDNKPESLKTDYFGEPDNPEGAKEKIKEYVDDLSYQDSVTEALEMLDKDILGIPEVSLFLSGECFVVRFEEGFVDENGHEITEEIDEVIFEGETNLPAWVREEVARKYKIKEQ